MGKQRIVAMLVGCLVVLAGCGGSSPFDAKPQQPEVSVSDLRATATTPRYDDLARTPEQFEGKALMLNGEVVQVSGSVLRVNVTEGSIIWTDTVWVNVKSEDAKVLKDDIIQFWGVGRGTKTYTTVLGGELTIPQMDAYAVEVVTKAGDRK